MIEELQAQIDTARRNLALAEQAGLAYEGHLHRARLDDLMDIAARHGIEPTAWTDQTDGPRAQTEGERT